MNCTECGKEIPEGENKICEDCKKNIVNAIAEEENNKEETEKVEKKKSNKKINKKMLGIVLLVVILIAVIALITSFAGKTVGSTIGNVRNYGYATESGNWIYFLSPNEESTQVGIFKIKKGDSEQKTKEQLAMDTWDVLSLNVSGDYVYFIGILSDEYSENDARDNKIYRMKTDGSDLKVINDNEFDNECYEIYVVGNEIYYIGTDYNVYKMDSNGGNRKLVLENGTGYLGITNKYIIYNVENEDSTDYVTYIADLDGKNERPIIENTRLYSVNIIGNYVYYTNESKHICRVKIDGTDQATLYETTAYNLNVYGNYIYYLNYADEANQDYTVCIYKVKANGSTETPELIKTLDTYSSFLDVVDNWIIYMDSNETEGFINLLKTDGKEEIKLYSLNYQDFYNSEEPTTNVTTP